MSVLKREFLDRKIRDPAESRGRVVWAQSLDLVRSTNRVVLHVHTVQVRRQYQRQRQRPCHVRERRAEKKSNPTVFGEEEEIIYIGLTCYL